MEPGEGTATEFAVEVTLPRPSVEVDDQEIGTDGLVTVRSVEVLAPTWVVIHADEDGSAGNVLGQVLLETGEYEDVTVPIRWYLGTPQLHAVLHEDSGEADFLDYPAADPPAGENGTAVAATFAAAYRRNCSCMISRFWMVQS
ncbi:MAG: hypothetical protein R3C44_07315 [Chloroflexota bacterium]